MHFCLGSQRWGTALHTEAHAHDGADTLHAELVEVLGRAFVDAAPETIELLTELCDWVTLPAGACLFTEGESGDAMYVVDRGRLRVFRGAGGAEMRISELGRGQYVGEGSLLGGTPRAASVYAIRDTRLLSLSREGYETLLSRDPEIGMQMARVALERARMRATDQAMQACFALAPASPGVDVVAFAEELCRAWGPDARVVTSQQVDEALARPGAAQVESGDGFELQVADFLSDLEAQHSHVVFVVDDEWTEWSRRALRSADRIVLVADATADPTPSPHEREMWWMLSRHHDPAVSLVLLHAAATKMPSGTPAWLDERSALASHHHVRRNDPSTMGRLARLLEGSGTSVVFGGGGAKGFAHLGIIQVLEDLGKPVDLVGGTSIGSVMATGIAMDLSAKECRELAAEQFRKILDYTLPVTSVLGGKRIARRMAGFYGDLDISDLWVPFFCVSTNLTQCRAEVHDRGPLIHALRASTSIPGVLPPVVSDGDLLIDGGVIDNVPVAEMRRRNPTGSLLAVDVAPASGPSARTDYGLAMSGTSAFLARRRGAGPPRLLTTMVHSTLVASRLQRNRTVEEHLADVYLDLESSGGGMLDFSKGDEAAQDAAERAQPILQNWVDGERPGYVRLPRFTPPAPPMQSKARHRGVLLLTARDLQMRATRFASAIIGTAVVFTMLFLMTGLNEQFKREPIEAVDALGANSWLLREGATGAFTSAETLPAALADRLKGVDATPLVIGRNSISSGELPIDIVIIGFAEGQLGEPDLIDGRLPEKPGEIVLDESGDIGNGTAVDIGSSSYTVVGHTEDTTLLAGMPLAFMHVEDAQALLFEGRPLATSILMSAPPDRVPKGFAVLDDEAIVADATRPLDGATSSVNLIRVLLWFVAAMIIGTLTYLSALDRRRDVAVLKAVGGGTGQLGTSIALQGVLVAIVAAAVATALQAVLVPVFPMKLVIPGSAYFQLPLIAVLVALLAGAAGLRKAVKTDPALAFSGPGA